MPEIFSRQLYDEWYASLSEEAKQRLAKKVQKKREKSIVSYNKGYVIFLHSRLQHINIVIVFFHVNQRRDNMAWMAELKRRHWYCICGLFMPHAFSKYLYDQWYSSLSTEDKQLLVEHKRNEKEKDDIELQECLRKIAMITSVCRSISDGPWTN